MIDQKALSFRFKHMSEKTVYKQTAKTIQKRQKSIHTTTQTIQETTKTRQETSTNMGHP